jgi:ferredoxin
MMPFPCSGGVSVIVCQGADLLAIRPLPAGPPGRGPQVQFARSAITARFGPPATTLLEFAEACDVPAQWSCRTGVCHNCETALISGTVDYTLEPLEPPAPGNILLCGSQPAEPVVIDL